MEHGGEAAQPTTVESTGVPGAGQGGEANMSTGTFRGQPSAAAAAARLDGIHGFEPSAAAYHNSTAFARQAGSVPTGLFHREHGPGAAYHASISEFRRQPQRGPVGVVLVGLQLPGGVVVPLHHDHDYSALLPRSGSGAASGVALADLLPGGGGGAAAVSYVVYALQPRPGAGQGDELVDLLPDGGADAVYYDNSNYAWQPRPRPGAGRGEALIGPLPGGVDAVYDGDYGYYYALQPHPGAERGVVLAAQLPGCGGGAVYSGDYVRQPRPGAGHGEVLLVDPLPDGAGRGEVFVGLLPGAVDAAYDDYGDYAWQHRPGARRGEVFVGPLPDGVGAAFDNSANFAPQTLLGTGRADGVAGALRGPNLGAGYDGSGTLADDLGVIHGDPGMAAEHLRRLIPFIGIGASSVAVNGLAAGPASPAAAFQLFVLLLGGLFLVILHVIRV